MFRQFFIYLSRQAWAYRAMLSNPLTRAMAWRFVAGENLETAIDRARLERARDSCDARPPRRECDERAGGGARGGRGDRHPATDRVGGGACISPVKPTQLGFDLGDDFCREQIGRILAVARETKNFVRIDMEGSPYTQRTLDLYAALREEYDTDTVGVVIQSYLRRSQGDLDRLIAAGARIRLVKGAYNEPPDLAFPQKADVDRAYRIQMEQLLARGRYPATPRTTSA
ncbi:MAG: proline dehydrogenase family protein [Thermomicrobiales bacterium]